MKKMAPLVERVRRVSPENLKAIWNSGTNLGDIEIIGPVDGVFKYELERNNVVYETLTNKPIQF